MNPGADILVADDSRTQLELLRHLLERAGYAVRAVCNGQKALESARQRRPDLIISDVIMPEMDGYQLCAAIKSDAALADVPVVLVTTLAEPQDIIRGLDAKADYYLTKPYDHEYLLSRVKSLLATPPSNRDEEEPTITLNGHSHVVHSTRRQMLNVLISTYESAIQQNRKLGEAQVELRTLYEKLAEDRNLLRTLVDTLPESIFVKDAEGHFILDNHTHMKFLGVQNPDQVSGKTVYDFYPAELADRYTADDRVVLRTGEPLINHEEEITDRSGRIRWMSTTKMPFRDGSGSWAGLVCASRDITARKVAQEQLATYAEELRQRNVQMEEDLKMARELQQAFLPPNDYCFPCTAAPDQCAVKISHVFQPATIIGGDFFDVLPLSETKVAIFIGDVMGHGVRPALVTSMVRVLTHELQRAAADPGEFLGALNRSLAGVLRQAKTPIFATAFFLVIDTAERALRFASAGHPAPLYLPAGGGIAHLRPDSSTPRGVALGVLPEAAYATSVRSLQEGDRLILFTDGLFEVENEAGDLYDEQQLMRAVERARNLGFPDLFSQLLREIGNFSSTRQFADDLCLVGVQASRLSVPA